jgi:tRNA threonylcarbamoyladenosine biosynthesis protein TsaB
MPVVLAFDTAGSACSVAVGRDSVILAYERCEMRHGHAEALLPMIDRVMAAAGFAATEIDVIAVSTGPGGFTGIRAGLAAAQGLALAIGAKLIGVGSFSAVAAGIPKTGKPLLVALDSRRADPYVQIFDGDGNSASEPAAILPEDFCAHVAKVIGTAALRIAGDAVEIAAALADWDLEVLPDTAPDSRGVLAAAFHQLAETGENPARPIYLRPPDVSFPKARA